MPDNLHTWRLSISTHTLTWSVTQSLRSILEHSQHFNSHAHVERDTTDYLGYYFGTISTHTLTWSVTFSASADFAGRGFQLTRSRGA